MKTKLSQRMGFTLIELMIVVGTIGLLAAMAIPNLIKARDRSKTNACINNLREIDSAKQQWALEKGKGSSALPDPTDLQPYIGRGTAGTLANVHCPLIMPPAPMGGYTINTMAELPKCNFYASAHPAELQ